MSYPSFAITPRRRQDGFGTEYLLEALQETYEDVSGVQTGIYRSILDLKEAFRRSVRVDWLENTIARLERGETVEFNLGDVLSIPSAARIAGD